MKLVHQYSNLSDPVVRVLYMSSEKLYQIAPIEFYKYDAGHIIILTRSGDTVNYTIPGYEESLVKARVVGLEKEILAWAENLTANNNIFFDIDRGVGINDKEDWAFFPLIGKNSTTVHFFMRTTGSSKEYYLLTDTQRDCIIALYAQSTLTSLMKSEEEDVNVKIKRFLINTQITRFGFQIPEIEDTNLKKMIIPAKLTRDYFPGELLVDLKAIGEKVRNKKREPLTSIVPETEIVGLLPESIISETITLSELTMDRHIKQAKFPIDILIDYTIDVKITRLVMTDSNFIAVYHMEKDGQKLVDRLTEWLPEFEFTFIDGVVDDSDEEGIKLYGREGD
jgi:hypothetical protein